MCGCTTSPNQRGLSGRGDTGASQGIGAALVTAYRERGYRVVATARSMRRSEDPDVLAVPGDIGERGTAERAIAEGVARFGRIDALSTLYRQSAPTEERAGHDLADLVREIAETQVEASGRRDIALALDLAPLRVRPEAAGQIFLVDHFRARFLFREPPEGDAAAEITGLPQRIGRQHRWMSLETLQRFDGADACTKAQGEG